MDPTGGLVPDNKLPPGGVPYGDELSLDDPNDDESRLAPLLHIW